MRYWLVLLALATLAVPGQAASPYQIEVFKSQRRLILKKDGKPIRTYRIALGKNPVGHKQVRGDNRTPEGSYYISSKHIGAFGPFLRVSYPGPQDAKRGVATGKISLRQAREIALQTSRGGTPPQNTRLGGNIGIHGWTRRGNPRTNWYDWTAGCIALTNEDAAELYRMVPVGTPLTIHP